jgi:hypothetical protein
MVRLIVFASLAAVVIVAFGGFTNARVQAVAVGLITAGGAMVVGGLLGFIFGVPFSRDSANPDQDRSEDKSKSPEAKGSSAKYRPNTSLEQIAEWLSKMLVGVGLVELKSVSQRFFRLAEFISKGLGGTAAADVFAYFLVLLFGGCGFLFGFIWARIYLKRWFSKADEDAFKFLDTKISKIQADAQAISTVTQQLYRSAEEKRLTVAELGQLFRGASRTAKAQIFDMARKASESVRDDPDGPERNESAISTLRALAEDDTNQYFHRTRAELAFALRRKPRADPEEVIATLSEAIRLRDEQNIPGWRIYEFNRARIRIEADDNFKRKRPSSDEIKSLVMRDIEVARADPKWENYIGKDFGRTVKEWIEINENPAAGPKATP